MQPADAPVSTASMFSAQCIYYFPWWFVAYALVATIIGEVLPQDSTNGVLLKPIMREYAVELQPAGWEPGWIGFAVSRS